MVTKKCSKCGEEKENTVENFNNIKTHKGEYKLRPECKVCSRLMCKNFKANNKQYISEYNSKYKAENKDDIHQYNAKYYKEHIETERERTRKTHKRLKETNPSFKIAGNNSQRIREALKGEKKSRRSKQLLGCDFEFFMTWLEYQLNAKMTLQNYGSYWHLDHVIPCASFDLTKEENQLKCFHWSNYQPLEAKENISKQHKILPEIIQNHKIKAGKFIEEIGKSLDWNYSII